MIFDPFGDFDYAQRLGQDRAFMAARPGEVMGYLAHGHPFLDGNGRTLMVVHIELDAYLKPFVGSAVARQQAPSALAQFRGLGPLK